MLRNSPACLRRLPVWLAVFLVGLSVYLFCLPADLRNNGDTVDRFFVTQALIRHQSLEIVCGANPNDTRLVLGRHGCYYSIYAPGQTLLMVPLYVLGDGIAHLTGGSPDFGIAVAVRSLDAILAALLLVVLYFLSRRLGYSRRTAIGLTLLIGFVSTLWPDEQSGQEHTQVALALAAAVLAVLYLRDLLRSRAPDRHVAAAAGLTGLACGFGLLTRYDFVLETVIIAAFGLWLGWRSSGPDRRRPAPIALGLVLGLLPFLVADGVWNAIRFGSPWNVGEAASAQFGFPIWQGVPNLLFSPAKGLIWYLPLVWLLPLALNSLRKRDGELAALLGVLFVVTLLFYANVVYWHGDPDWGPRYLFVVVPIFLLPLGDLLRRVPRMSLLGRGSLAAVILLSLAVQLVAVSVDQWRFWYHLIGYRQAHGEVFTWSATGYNYYWTRTPSLDPELYQFQSLGSVIGVSTGSRSDSIYLHWQNAAGPAGTSIRATDTRMKVGVSKHPMNSFSPIWLNTRYEWTTPEPVPMSAASRIIVVAALALLFSLGAASLHGYFWSAETGPAEETSGSGPGTVESRPAREA
jgi:hypothetical protein